MAHRVGGDGDARHVASADRVGAAPHVAAAGDCPQINAPALSTLSPLENHQLAGWDDLIRKLGDAELIDGMFKVN